MTRNEKLTALRASMKEQGINWYLVDDADPHLSEYVSAHDKERSWLSGFTGSNGQLLISDSFAGLWTDGRYTLQAKKQMEGTEYEIFIISERGTKRLSELLIERACAGDVVGVNGKLFSYGMIESLAKKLEEKGARVRTDADLLAPLWSDRPANPTEPAVSYPAEYHGEETAEKLEKLRKTMKDLGTDVLAVTTLDDTNWLFNIRGNDVADTPVVQCFGLVTGNGCTCYIKPEKMPPEVETELKKNGVLCKDYDTIADDLAALPSGTKLGLVKNTVNAYLAGIVPETVEKVFVDDPVERQKMCKNAVETKWAKQRHIDDGVALVQFFCWLSKHFPQTPMTEWDIVLKLRSFRQKLEGYTEDSFETIAGYGPNGAIVHYQPMPDASAKLEPKGLLLIDSGAQLLGATTDITRTVVLGPLSEEEKHDFTLVLKSWIALSSAVFPEGTTGKQLDTLAREVLWKEGIDYQHGTGHGVGAFIACHEGPVSFSNATVPMKEGMIISVEPGIYKAGSHGIRTENLAIVEKAPFEHFLQLTALTRCPVDQRAIDVSMLNRQEKDWLNTYHEAVWNDLNGRVDGETREWLRQATARID